MVLDRVRPQDRDIGTLAYLWNPAVLVEVAGEGHNDAITTLLALASRPAGAPAPGRGGVLAMVGGRPDEVRTACCSHRLCWAIWWRGAQDKQLVLWRIAGGAVAGAGVAAALLRSLLGGSADFLRPCDRRVAPDTPAPPRPCSRKSSPGSSASRRRWSPSRSLQRPRSVLAAIVIAVRVRTPTDLLRGTAVLMVVYTLLVGPAYWPWYVVLPIAFLALVPRGTFLVLIGRDVVGIPPGRAAQLALRGRCSAVRPSSS